MRCVCLFASAGTGVAGSCGAPAVCGAERVPARAPSRQRHRPEVGHPIAQRRRWAERPPEPCEIATVDAVAVLHLSHLDPRASPVPPSDVWGPIR
jgi:hypothetical protein